jgi:hypothetical protein
LTSPGAIHSSRHEYVPGWRASVWASVIATETTPVEAFVIVDVIVPTEFPVIGDTIDDDTVYPDISMSKSMVVPNWSPRRSERFSGPGSWL